MQVKATQPGYYGKVYRFVGDVFNIGSEADFSENWMEAVSPGKSSKGKGKAKDSKGKKNPEESELEAPEEELETAQTEDNKEK